MSGWLLFKKKTWKTSLKKGQTQDPGPWKSNLPPFFSPGGFRTTIILVGV